MFIALKKIKSEKELENGFVEVTFEDNTSETFNKEILETVKTKKESDLTTVRDEKCKIILKKLLDILLEYNAKTSEIPHLMNSIANVLHNSEKEAFEKLIGASTENVTMLKIDEILKSN